MNSFSLADYGSSVVLSHSSYHAEFLSQFWDFAFVVLIFCMGYLVLLAFLDVDLSDDDDDRGGYDPGGDGGGGTKNLDDVKHIQPDPEPEPEPEPEPPVIEITDPGEIWKVGDDLDAEIPRTEPETPERPPTGFDDSNDRKGSGSSDGPPSLDVLPDIDDLSDPDDI